MSMGSIRLWHGIHKWTSLICTIFLLIICLTGLPLVFSDEIDHWLHPHDYVSLPADTPTISMDRVDRSARELFPNEIVTSSFVDDDEPQVFVWMAPSWATLKADPKSAHFIRFDSRTGQVLEKSKPATERNRTFMEWMFSLHTDLFLKLPGELFLGFMGLLFVIATVSGVVLYAPFVKKLRFGTVRADRSTRLKWLDLHNLLGIVTLAWVFVVGVTGVINELSTPLFGLWKQTEAQRVMAPWRGQPPVSNTGLTSVQAAFDLARRAAPGVTFSNVTYPGSPYGSPYHYLLWGKGDTNLTSRLFTPVLVDARSGELTAVMEMPWYLRALEVSRPLHFGDYGGVPLKILWALLDLMAIVVLGSGVYLWLARRKHARERLEKFVVERMALSAGAMSKVQS